MRTIPFTHKNQQYEVRIVSDGGTIYVRAFKDGRPANGYGYQVSVPLAFDMDRLLSVNAVQKLIDDAKRDIIDGTWDRLLATLEAQEP